MTRPCCPVTSTLPGELPAAGSSVSSAARSAEGWSRPELDWTCLKGCREMNPTRGQCPHRAKGKLRLGAECVCFHSWNPPGLCQERGAL